MERSACCARCLEGVSSYISLLQWKCVRLQLLIVLSALVHGAKILKIATMVKLFLITGIRDPDEIMF